MGQIPVRSAREVSLSEDVSTLFAALNEYAGPGWHWCPEWTLQLVGPPMKEWGKDQLRCVCGQTSKKPRKKMWRTELHPATEVTVCDVCMRAACAQGLFFCEKYKESGTEQVEVGYLLELGLEHPDYWIPFK